MAQPVQPENTWQFTGRLDHHSIVAIAQPHIVEAVANHVSGHKAGVAGVYNKSVYAEEKRQALDSWANALNIHLGGLGTHPAGLVSA